MSRTLTVTNLFWNCKVAILVRHFIQLDIDKVRRWDEILSFNKVFNSLSLCFVYLVLFYKPFQTFIIYFTCIVSLCRSDPTPRKIDSWLVLQTLYIYIYIHNIISRNNTNYFCCCFFKIVIPVIISLFKKNNFLIHLTNSIFTYM